MFIPSFTKKFFWLILAFFALAGIGLGIALPITHIFTPFGTTVWGLLGAGELLFIGCLAAVLFIVAIDALIEWFSSLLQASSSSKVNTSLSKPDQITVSVTQQPVEQPQVPISGSLPPQQLSTINGTPFAGSATAPTSTLPNIPTPVSSPVKPLGTPITPVSSPIPIPLQTKTPPFQPLLSREEQSEQDAEKVRKHIVGLFQPGGEFYTKEVEKINLGDPKVFYAMPSPNDEGSYEIVLKSNQFFSSNSPEKDSKNCIKKAPSNLGAINTFVAKINGKWKGTAEIFSKDDGATHRYWVTIFPAKIQEILRDIPTNAAQKTFS